MQILNLEHLGIRLSCMQSCLLTSHITLTANRTGLNLIVTMTVSTCITLDSLLRARSAAVSPSEFDL